MSGTIGLAVYGLARESFPRLGNLLAASANVQLRWVVDKDPLAASQALRESLPEGQHPNVIKPGNWDQLLKDEGLDGIVISSALPGINMVRKALGRGKAVMCEHPISLQQEAVKACYEAAHTHTTPLMFAFNKRFDSPSQSIRARVQSGALGQVYSIRSAACYEPLETNGPHDQGAIFRDCVAEEVDTISWILNDSPHTVFATGSGLACNMPGESPTDSVAMTMRFPNGTLATLDVKKATCAHDSHMEINGSQGVLLVDPHHPEGTAIHMVNKEGTHSEILTSSLNERRQIAFSKSITHFANVIRGDEDACVDEIDALRATDISAAGLQSHLSNASVARETERRCTAPEVLVHQRLWDEVPNSYNGVMPPLQVVQ